MTSNVAVEMGVPARVGRNMQPPDWLAQTAGILETLNEGVLIVDEHHRILYANDSIQQMSGFTLSEGLGRPAYSFYGGEDLRFIIEQLARVEEQGRNRYEFYLPRRDGGQVPALLSSRIVTHPDGQVFRVIVVGDITEQKEAENKLREANRRLERRHQELEKEMALAARVQQSLAPTGLRGEGVEVETHFAPVHTIGGDFGMVTPLGDGQLNLLVCDVSGHGIGSALIANRIYTETTALLERRAELDVMLRRLNRFVVEQIRIPGFFFSLAAARLDTRNRRMTFANAGHPPAIWVSPSGECRLLPARSTVLGLLENAVSDQPAEEIELGPGDRLVLYTDGFTEVFNRHGEGLGVERLKQIVCRAARLPLAQMKQTILYEVGAWRHGPHTDDMSLVVAELL